MSGQRRHQAPKSRAYAEAGSARLARWSGLLVCFVVAVAPLPLGSVGPPAVAILSVLLGIALLGLLTVKMQPGPFAVVAVALCMFLCCAAVLYFQITAAPLLTVPADPIWAEASKLLGQDLAPSVAVIRNQPFFSFGLCILCFLSFTTALLLSANRKQARQLLMVVAGAGAIYAVFAIVTHLIEPDRIFLIYEKQAHQAALTSPFLNRNTAAMYYGCCGLIWLMRGCELFHERLAQGQFSRRKIRAQFQAAPVKPILKAAAGLMVCMLAMFLTGSRAGVGASLIAMTIAVAAFFHRRINGRFGTWKLLLAAGVAALALLYLLGGAVGGRFSAQGLSDEGRLSVYRSTLRIIMDHSWLGSGFGSFEWVFPAYRSDDISQAGIWNRAHNSLLELMSSGGVPLAFLLVAGGLAGFWTLLRGVLTRHRDVIFPTVALAAALAAVLQSMVDFSLQIPGYAIVIYALFGMGMAQSFRSKTAMRSPGKGTQIDRLNVDC